MEPFIALIEDDKEVSEFLSMKMNEAGLNVKPCFNGDDGLKLALSESCQMVVMDLIIPGIMGVDLIKKIREKKRNLPLLVISGAGPSEIDEASKAGANLCLEKPIDDLEFMKHLVLFSKKSGSPD